MPCNNKNNPQAFHDREYMAIFSLINRCHLVCFRFVEEFQKVLSVLVPEQRRGKCAQFGRRDPPVAVGDAFQTGDLKLGL